MGVDFAELVADDYTWVSRQAFRDPEIHAAEQERIFKRCWMFLGHESQVPEPGDFFTTYMGEEAVIVTRGLDGALHALVNSCRHRGMRVCRADRGNTKRFSCPYHSWTYNANGELIGVPRRKEGYYDEIDLSQNGLIQAAQVDSYKGLIFATFAADAPSLLHYLGDMAWYMDLILDRDGGTELIPGIHKWVVRANWKLPCDNNAGDWYHVAFAHGSSARLNQNPNQFDEDDNRLQISAETGHTLCAYQYPAGKQWMGAQHQPRILNEYFEETAERRAKLLGPDKDRMHFIAGNVFPNFSWIPGSYTIRQYHPRGPDKTEVWSYCLVDAAAPREVKDAMKRMYTNSFGPSGLLEQDDGENWTGCSASSNKPVMGRQSFNYQMGVGHEWHKPGVPGQHVGRATSEVVQRSFYRRWLQEMTGQSERRLRVVAQER